MLNDEDLANQQDLLAAHRRTLAVYLRQQAELGVLAPPGVVNGIAEACAQIHRVKTNLRSNGMAVEDHPDDDQPGGSGTSSIVLRADQPIFFIPDSLPPGYIERADALAALRGALLDSHAAGGVVAVTALHGLGGLGKTVLARAICDDPVVRAAFPNGVLWATLGQTAEPARHQRDWIAALGGDVAAASSLERGVVELRRQLERRSMLLVLDDIWNAADATPLQVGGPRCATLLTTRNASQAEGAVLVPLELMRQAESRALLRGSARGKLANDALADVIAARLGHLPLALAIVGALLARGMPWTDIAEALDQGDLAFLAHGQKSVLAAVATSVRTLPDEQAARYRELVIFPDDEPLAESAVVRLWKATAGLKGREARRLLVELRDRALIQNDNRLHDLQYDYLRAAVPPTDWRGLHSTLADAYTELSTGIPTAGDDIYGWERLAYHLAGAERNDDLGNLLHNGAYLQEKIARLGTSALLADFALLPRDEAIEYIAGALRLGAHVLDREPRELENQLVGRLGPLPQLRNLPDDGRPRFRLLSHTLTAPGGPLVQTLVGHTDWVNSCAFGPDGKLALSASDDRTLRLWDIATGQTVRVLKGHTSRVEACAFNPDGKLALSASDDRTLRLWDIATGQTVRVLKGHTSRVEACAFSPNGRLALSASFDTTLRLWELATGQTLHVFKGHTQAVTGCAFSPDGKLALSAALDQSLRLWDIATGQTVRILEGHFHYVNACAFSLDGQLALSASEDCTLRLWEVATGQTLHVLKGHTSWVNDCMFSPDSTLALSASGKGDLWLWDIASGQALRQLKGHTNDVTSCAFSPNGRLMLSASHDKTLRLWNLTSDLSTHSLDKHIHYVSACAFDPHGELALIASSAGKLQLWHVALGLSLRISLGRISRVNACAFSPNGRLALSALENHTLRLWEVAAGQTLHVFKGHTDAVTGCAFSPDGLLVLSASNDETLRVWEVASGTCVSIFEDHSGRITSCAFSPDGRLILSASWDTTLRLWDRVSGQILRVLKGHSDTVTSCVFSPDGQLALSASEDRTLRLWEVATGQTLWVFEGHTSCVSSCAFSPDSTLILSASEDRTLRLWNLGTGVDMAHWEADVPEFDLATVVDMAHWEADAPLRCCAFHPDGQRIIAGGDFGHLHWLQLENV
jgi:WD40 repeat protein